MDILCGVWGSGYLKITPSNSMFGTKIDTLYEGTTRQALDLLFRKVAKDGNTLQSLLRQMGRQPRARPVVKPASVRNKVCSGSRRPRHVGSHAKMGESIYCGTPGNRILFSLAELTIGWLLVRQAEVAATCYNKRQITIALYQVPSPTLRRRVLPAWLESRSRAVR